MCKNNYGDKKNLLKVKSIRCNERIKYIFNRT